MGDMGDVFRAMRADKQERHAANRIERAEILRKADVRFETRNDGAHLIVEGQGGKIDFWPGTGKWIARNGKNGRGINSLLAATIRDGLFLYFIDKIAQSMLYYIYSMTEQKNIRRWPMFFTQLAKLTATSQIKILMTGVAGGKINLIIDPRPLGDAKNAPPLAPMTFTATPEELDAELPALLANYADRTISMFAQFEAQMLEIEQNAATKVADKKAEATKKTAPAARTIATKAATVKPASTSGEEEGDDEETGGESANEQVVEKPAVKSAAEQQTSLLELF